MEMTSIERIGATTSFQEPDRVPIALLGITIGARMIGVTTREYCTDGRKLALGQIAFAERFGTDMIFLFPDVWYLMEGPWGGKLRYFDTPYDTPVVEEYAIKNSENWEEIEVMDPSKDARMPVIREAYRTAYEMGSHKKWLMPIFADSPLTMATRIRGLEEFMLDLILQPELVHTGLETITKTIIEHIKSLSQYGNASVIALTRCSAEIFTWKQYEEFGKPYDLRVLRAMKEIGLPPAICHICGLEPYLDEAIRFDHVIGFSWWDKGAKPSLKEAKEKFKDKAVLVCGIDQNRTLLFGSSIDVEKEVKESIEIGAPGGGFILATGCELSARTPDENIVAAVSAAKKFGKYPIKP